ncbi:LPXTG cell wall anchor domain-containing protein [Streptomyces sp. NPDC006368]|uniref:LPXTG cell wall anchor domain-containing protein n=1 Tax=Streptomyces sp. NPDC006368 TaxID=3156760 RepID=UPI0033BBAB23
MRMLTYSGVLVATAACSLVFAPSALATKGDNGTVKIHDAATGEELRKNEPKVCEFYLDAFGFDAGQLVDWHIEAWGGSAGAKGGTVESGSLTLDAQGHGRTADMTLPDGHYKLFWNFDGENGRAKHKVFKTDCEPATSTPGDKDKPGGKDDEGGKGGKEEEGGKGGGSAPTPAQSTAPEATAPEATTPAATAPAAAPSTAPAAAKPAPSASDAAEGDLAETGSSAPVGVLGAVAAALVAGGGYLVLRRRKAQQH